RSSRLFNGDMKLRCSRVFVFGLLTAGQAMRFFAAEAVILVADGAAHKPRGEPQIVFFFPVGALRNVCAPSGVELRGYGLEKAYAIWSDCGSITAEIKAVEEIKAEEKQKSTKDAVLSRVTVQLSLAPEAAIGTHFIRVISADGISNASPFVVYE